MPLVDILIPTYERLTALAVTLTSVISQRFRDFRIVVSDQSESLDVADSPEVRAIARVLKQHGTPICIEKHLPRRGIAEQRQFLLDRADAPYALFLDDDLILEPEVVGRMVETIEREGCGFVGTGTIGLSHADDVREQDQAIEFWDGRVSPETVGPGSWEWSRSRLHSAANLLHAERRLGLRAGETATYKVAWAGAAVVYDREKLLDCGGFSFWSSLPSEHSGEDVLAQMRVMAKYGRSGVLPCGVYHEELPTTIRVRDAGAPYVLPGDAAG